MAVVLKDLKDYITVDISEYDATEAREWCVNTFGVDSKMNRTWYMANVIPSINGNDLALTRFYFKNGSDANLFRLKWL